MMGIITDFDLDMSTDFLIDEILQKERPVICLFNQQGPMRLTIIMRKSQTDKRNW